MRNHLYLFISISCLLCSCKQFLQIDPPKTSLIQQSVYQNNETATAAVLGIYSGMAGSGYAGGSSTSISSLAGLTSNELVSYSADLQEFYDNKVSASSSTLKSLYLLAYQHIFAANAVLEGLADANAITPPVKAQLQGEAYFTRAFIYFYLANLFGEIPLQLTTDYRVTRLTPLSTQDQVYDHITADLKKAEELLTDQYIATERIRPNLSAVQAMLARVYLYRKDWLNAEKYAGLVIAKTGTYSLPVPDNAFLKDSPEAIWQLFPTAGANTREGNLFILTATPTIVALNSNFALTGFESGDKRKDSWLRSFTNTTGTYHYPFKYKVKSSAVITEYSMVLRLAEQYLIRAEARARQNNLDGAIADLDKIRARAGLPLFKDTSTNISQADMLTAIQQERKVELFTEWGHRWFDLKRTGQLNNTFYPLPTDEVTRNPNIQ
jgi:hypothetical protein